MLRLRLFGDLAVEVDGSTLPPPESARARALLAWLALHPGMHPRGRVPPLFGPAVPDSSARASLRSAMWSLRRALGENGERHLEATRDRVGLVDAEADVQNVDDLAARGELEEAAALGDGELLPGVDDDWAFEARDAHRDRMASILSRLAAGAEDPSEAARWAKRWTALDPL